MTKLEDFTVEQLHAKARRRNLVGHSSLRKDDLVALLRDRKSPTAKRRCKRRSWVKSRSKKNRACRKKSHKRKCSRRRSRSRSTNRCRKRRCPAGSSPGKVYTHHKSGKKTSRCRKKCPAGKVRDPVTGRCRKRKSPGRKRSP